MIGDVFTSVLLDPMINTLIVLNNVFFSSVGISIIIFTMLIRILTFPLTLRQLRQTRAMQAIGPQVQEINKKYSDPRRRQQEVMKAYREAGVNPLGCAGPFALQFPILIALFVAVRITLPQSPEALERLSGHLYDWSYIQHAIPLGTHFLGIDLRTPNMVFVVLVALSTFLQTKTTITPTTDEKARAQQQMMTFLMPIMLAFFALNLPSGVSLYWIVSGLVSIASNVAIYGVPSMRIQPLFPAPHPATKAVEPSPATRSTTPNRPARTTHGSNRSKRKNRRRRS